MDPAVLARRSEGLEGERAEITASLRLFKLRSVVVGITPERVSFLEELCTYAHPSNVKGDGISANYTFAVAHAGIQMDVCVGEREIDLLFFITYVRDHVREELEELLEIDRLLYHSLQRVGLQK